MDPRKKNPTLIIGVIILLLGLTLGSWNSYPKFWSNIFDSEPQEEPQSPLAPQVETKEYDR